MKIAILSNELNTLRIETGIKALFRYAANEKVALVEADGRNRADLIIIDFDVIDKYRDTMISYSYAGVLLFLDGFLFDPYDTESSKKIEDQLICAKRWHTLRRINNAKIYLNHLNRKLVLDTMPNFLQLEVTNHCSGRCIMCPHFYLEKKDAKHLQQNSFEKIQPILPYIQVAVLHGNGEPFMNPCIEEHLKVYKKYDISISACTNLSIFNERLAALVNDCFSDIRISCDACTKEVYENIRIGLSFDRFVKNLRLLRDGCRSIHKVLTFVIMRQNISQIPLMVSFAHEYGFEEIIYSNMLPSIALGNEADAPLHYGTAVKHQLELAEHSAKEYGLKLTYPNIYDKLEADSTQIIDESFRSPAELDDQLAKIKEAIKDETPYIEELQSCSWRENEIPCSGICDWLIERTYIDIEGNVIVCCINSTYRIGNIHEASFEQIWNSRIMQEVRKHFYDGHLPVFCHSCQFILNDNLSFLDKVKIDEGFIRRKRNDMHRGEQ